MSEAKQTFDSENENVKNNHIIRGCGIVLKQYFKARVAKSKIIVTEVSCKSEVKN